MSHTFKNVFDKGHPCSRCVHCGLEVSSAAEMLNAPPCHPKFGPWMALDELIDRCLLAGMTEDDVVAGVVGLTKKGFCEHSADGRVRINFAELIRFGNEAKTRNN